MSDCWMMHGERGPACVGVPPPRARRCRAGKKAVFQQMQRIPADLTYMKLQDVRSFMSLALGPLHPLAEAQVPPRVRRVIPLTRSPHRQSPRAL